MKITQLLHFLFVTLLIFVLASCRNGVVKVDNEMEGKLTATFQLAEKGEKNSIWMQKPHRNLLICNCGLIRWAKGS